MNDFPKVSVIIPVYNMEDYLGKCIDSVLNQSYKEIEILLLNDGSTDSSEEIMDRYTSTYPELIRKINKSNTGLADTLNEGVKNAVGDFILFLDSDDYLTEDCLETLMAKATEKNADVVVSGQFKVDEEGNILQKIEYKPVNDKCYRLRLNLHGKLYKRNYILEKQIQFPVGFLYEDNSFNLQAFFLSERLFFVNYCGYSQLVRKGSITSKAITKDRLPLGEWERVIKLVLSNKGTDKELFEFTVLSLFAYLLFIRIRKREFKIEKNQSFNNTDNAVMIAEEFERIASECFDLKRKNKYIGIKKYNQIGFKQKIAVILFRNACRKNKIQRLTRTVYKFK